MSEGADGYGHKPVMPEQVLRLLAPVAGETAVDGTVGLGGHSLMIGRLLGPDGTLVCFDRDPEALARAGATLSELECRREFVNRSFEFMAVELKRLGAVPVRRILLDLGVSSLQLDKPERGFSFMRDGPLDMRMNPGAGPSARDIVNGWPEERLRHIFQTLGEERFSRRLAKRIVEAREKKPIETTGELSALLAAGVPYRGRIHPATRVFQAIRMEVNDELGALSRGLSAAGRVLAPGGRLAVLTFHSLEDRLVKRTFQRWCAMGAARPVNARAESCDADEARENRRARSAKLRVVERL